MKSVDLIVEAAFGAAPFVEPTTWTRLPGVRRLSKRSGRRARYLPMPPAEVVVELDNRDGALDPMNTAGPYFPNVRRDTPVRIRLDATGLEPVNLLTADQATPQGKATGAWRSRVNATMFVSSLQVDGPGGERSHAATAAAAGAFAVETVAAVPVVAGRSYTLQYRSLAAEVGRPRGVAIEWYDSVGAVLATTPVTALGPSLLERWTRASASGFVAPAGAASGRPILHLSTDTLTPAGQGQFFGRVSLAEGPFRLWTAPGNIYPLFRGYALSWTADYAPSGKDSTVTLVATDIFRLFAEHRLWRSLAEHDLLDGFCGPRPVHHYPLDEGDVDTFRDMFHPAAAEVVGRGLETTSGKKRLRWDPRQFTALGGGEVISRITVPNSVIANPALSWAIECVFSTNKPSGNQHLVSLGGTLVELQTNTTRIEAVVEMSDGTRRSVISASGAIVGGRTYLARLACDSAGAVRLYLNDAFIGANTGGGVSLDPAAWGTAPFTIGSTSSGLLPLDGDIGRVSFYDVASTAAVHSVPYWSALREPWSHTPNTDDRMRFLFEEFRHRKDSAGATVAGTYPGIPAAWYDLDDAQVPVQHFYPAGRTMLEYLQSLDATEQGLLRVKTTGTVRMRSYNETVRVPKKPSYLFGNGANVVPVRSPRLGRTVDVVTVVNYSRFGIDASSELRSGPGIDAYGEVEYSLPQLETRNDADARVSARAVLDQSAAVPPRPSLTFELKPTDPAVGWDVVALEPADVVSASIALPQYTHTATYELLDVNIDAAGGEVVVSVNAVGQ